MSYQDMPQEYIDFNTEADYHNMTIEERDPSTDHEEEGE